MVHGKFARLLRMVWVTNMYTEPLEQIQTKSKTVSDDGYVAGNT